jgi:hypothetical protein
MYSTYGHIKFIYTWNFVRNIGFVDFIHCLELKMTRKDSFMCLQGETINNISLGLPV